MKTLVIDIVDPADGDLVIIQYVAPRGGRSHVAHRIVGDHQTVKATEDGTVTELVDVPAQTPRDIAGVLAAHINSEWLRESFQARVSDENGALLIFCQDTVSDVKFSAEVTGSGGTKISVKEF